jgi:hypothetical protein
VVRARPRAGTKFAAGAPRVNANRAKNATRGGASGRFYWQLKYRGASRAESARAHFRNHAARDDSKPYARDAAIANESGRALLCHSRNAAVRSRFDPVDLRARICVGFTTDALPLCGGQPAAQNPKSSRSRSVEYYASNACADICSFVLASFSTLSTLVPLFIGSGLIFYCIR